MDELITLAGEFFDVTIASEMAGQSPIVPVNPEVIARVTEGDSDPKFATFVIESGWSKSRRYWGPELFSSVASEINMAAFDGEPVVGYQGHIPENLDAFAFPDIQLQWVGAKMLDQNGENARMAVKAYLLPDTKARDYFRRGLVKTVSWRGKIAQEVVKGGVKVKQFAIESIDLSRPRAAGMSARMVGALSSEMTDTEGGNSVKPEEIAALQENELRAYAPALVAQIETAARAPLDAQVSEMTTTAQAVVPTIGKIAELRTALGLDESVSDENVILAVIKEIRQAGKTLRDSVLEKVLSKKFGDAVKNSTDYALLRRAVVGEMTTADVKLTDDEEANEKTVSEMVNSIIDGDDDLKKVVSEMAQTPASPPSASENHRGTGSDRDLKPGYSNSNIRVRAAQ